MQKKSFDQWMSDVDAILIFNLGLESADLPDCCYADWYEDGMSPRSAASKAIRAAKCEE